MMQLDEKLLTTSGGEFKKETLEIQKLFNKHRSRKYLSADIPVDLYCILRNSYLVCF